MADEIDKANEVAEVELQARLSKRYKQVEPTGHCFNCDEKLPPGRRLFCDLDCKEDWERRSRIR
jgi:RNA polymerase-binding transcription factor DksA